MPGNNLPGVFYYTIINIYNDAIQQRRLTIHRNVAGFLVTIIILELSANVVAKR